MGTSSILSGTVLKAIYEFMNVEMSNDEISYEVLRLEQLMSTGGGWQDQVGGLVKGLKLITTDVGISQKLDIKKIQIPDKILKELNNI